MGKGGGSAAGSYEHRRSEKGLATVGSHLNKTLGILVQFWEWKDSARTSTTLDSDIIMTELCLHVLALQDHRYRSCHIFAQIAIFVVSQCWNFGRCSCRTLRVCTCRGFQRKFLPSFICLEHAGIIESRSVYRAGNSGRSQFLLVVPCYSLFALGLALGNPGVAHAVKHPTRTSMQMYDEHPSTPSQPLTLLLLFLSRICCRRLPPHTLNNLSAIAGLLARAWSSRSLVSDRPTLYTHTRTHSHTH